MHINIYSSIKTVYINSKYWYDLWILINIFWLCYNVVFNSQNLINWIRHAIWLIIGLKSWKRSLVSVKNINEVIFKSKILSSFILKIDQIFKKSFLILSIKCIVSNAYLSIKLSWRVITDSRKHNTLSS